MTVAIWLLVACFILGGVVGAHGAGGEGGRRVGAAFVLALVIWGGIGLMFATYFLLAYIWVGSG